LSRIKKWFGPKKQKSEKEYDEEKREFEAAIGRPSIAVKVELPEDFDDMKTQFLELEDDASFHEEVKDLIKKRLLYDKHRSKPST
jgi:hypothetical protein